MPMFYSNPARENDSHALPDREVTWLTSEEAPCEDEETRDASLAGWYWCACFPGCMPDSEWTGPFETVEEAMADGRDDDEEETP